MGMSAGHLQPRQLWNLPTTTSSSSTATCTPYTLPSNGVLSFASDNIVTLTSNVIYSPVCTAAYSTAGSNSDNPSSVADLENPFYASTIPQAYVIAAATIIAWVLVIMLIINPRSFYAGGPGGASNIAAGRGMIGGATGVNTSPGVGSRPWLQKVAALATAVSLTIATADTFKVAEAQYLIGYMDGDAMRSQVEGSIEVRVTRVISDVFLWLAQVQTLIRLFPRHKEKVVIKWIGFALIILDTTFSCLNSFMVDSSDRPRRFVDAIPALSYLFELAVGLLYAAWVIFYGLTKRRYAYFHLRMKSISVVALMSHVAILTPAVFFITDVAEPDVAAWGDYFRWVGAAASSVIVWEWVERIEALEKDEKKDGILGREIFDGDEMIDMTPGEHMIYTRKPRDEYRPLDRTGSQVRKTGSQPNGISRFPSRRQKAAKRNTHLPLGRAHSDQRAITFGNLPRPETALTATAGPTPPPPRLSPPDRANTTSAASTVYVINYDGESQGPQPLRRRTEDIPGQSMIDVEAQVLSQSQEEGTQGTIAQRSATRLLQSGNSLWQTVQNPFKRKRMSPPAEVRAARDNAGSSATSHSFARWDIKGRLGALAAEQGEKFRERKTEKVDDIELSWTVVPAPTRGAAAWSPNVLKQNKDDEDIEGSSEGTQTESRQNSGRDSNSSHHVTWASSTTAGESHGENNGQSDAYSPADSDLPVQPQTFPPETGPSNSTQEGRMGNPHARHSGGDNEPAGGQEA